MPTIDLPASIFLNEMFADDASFVINGAVVPGKGILDEEYNQFDPGAENSQITFLIERGLSDQLSHNDRLLIAERNRGFQVIGKQPVGDGAYVELILEEIGVFLLPVTDILIPQTSGFYVIQLSDLRVLTVRGA